MADLVAGPVIYLRPVIKVDEWRSRGVDPNVPRSVPRASRTVVQHVESKWAIMLPARRTNALK